jgi:hypothetical protein
MRFFVLILFFAALLVFHGSYAQDKEKKIPRHRTKFSLGITGSPDYYVYDFNVNNNYHLSYKSKLNYSYGITAVYYPVKFISFRVALLYSTKGYTVNYTYNASNPPTADSLTTQTFNATYLDVPLILHFNLIHKDRVQLFIAAGIVPGILLNKAGEYVKTNGLIISDPGQVKNFNTLLTGTSYSLGLKYNLSPKIGLGIEPYFRYYLTKIDKETMGKTPISFGGKFAIYINFNHKHHKNTPWGSL